jgi:acetyl esterase/lipase
MKRSVAILSIILIAAVFLAAQTKHGTLHDRLQQRQQEKAAQAIEDGEAPGNITIPSNVKVIGDVSYGPDPAQKFDVYIPAGAHNAPVIFMVHGGGWRIGDKTNAGVVEKKLAHWSAKGYVFISINYRMLPNTKPLEQAQDVAKAVATAQAKASEWGADPKKFILMGHSAGAHLVALLASSADLASKQGARPWLGTVILDSATLETEQLMKLPHMPLYDDAFGTDKDYWRATSPYAQLTRNSGPMLAVCSSKRRESCPNAKTFAVKAKAMGVRVEVLEEPLSHGDINKTLGQKSAYTESIDKFVESLRAN